MTIKKFQGKTKEEAIEAARAEMGQSVVIMNVKEIHGKGIFGFLKKSTYEVTAATEDDALPTQPFSVNRPSQDISHTSFQAVADEPISIPPIQEEAVLKDAFAAVSQVMEKQQFRPLTEVEQIEQITTKEPSAVKQESAPVKQDPQEDELSMPRFREELREEQQTFFKMMYKVLLEQEVNEIYINQLMDDVERVTHSTDGLQFLISNVYQKMILKLGQPQPITLASKKPKVAFFLGPTGVGKTTTIAKLASKCKVELDKKVALLTTDTYRIAAAEQLRTYANILETPLSIIYAPEDLEKEMEKVEGYDLVLVDTAGFSHKNVQQREDMKTLLSSLPEKYEKEIYLVLSVTTKYKDLVEITEIYKEFCNYSLIFTKLDETGAYGNIYNIRLHTQAPLSYFTTGQNVPNDIEEVDSQKLVKQLLGGR